MLSVSILPGVRRGGFWAALLALLLLATPAWTQAEAYDGFELVQNIGRMNLARGGKVQFLIVRNRDGVLLVGMYVSADRGEARLYLDDKRWTELQALLAQAESAMSETGPGEHQKIGTVRSLRVWSRDAELRVEVLGKTRIDDRNLLVTAVAGASSKIRIPMALGTSEQEELHKRIDQVNTWLADLE